VIISNVECIGGQNVLFPARASTNEMMTCTGEVHHTHSQSFYQVCAAYSNIVRTAKWWELEGVDRMVSATDIVGSWMKGIVCCPHL
jgi:hypothetical protein